LGKSGSLVGRFIRTLALGGNASINQWRGQQTDKKNRYENANYRWPHQ
jgi:hypothetical protein